MKEKYEKLESELLEERKKTKEKYEKLELKYLEERKKMKKINENLTNKNHELVEMVNPFMMSVEELQAQLASCTCGKKDGGAAGNTYPVQVSFFISKKKILSCATINILIENLFDLFIP